MLASSKASSSGHAVSSEPSDDGQAPVPKPPRPVPRVPRAFGAAPAPGSHAGAKALHPLSHGRAPVDTGTRRTSGDEPETPTGATPTGPDTAMTAPMSGDVPQVQSAPAASAANVSAGSNKFGRTASAEAKKASRLSWKEDSKSRLAIRQVPLAVVSREHEQAGPLSEHLPLSY